MKALKQDHPLNETTEQIIKNAIGVFEKYNHVRNNRSFAHDNDLLQQAEGRFIFDSISAILRFIKVADSHLYGQ